jgi:hypothetical protein
VLEKVKKLDSMVPEKARRIAKKSQKSKETKNKIFIGGHN